jgi:hypothetical protein
MKTKAIHSAEEASHEELGEAHFAKFVSARTIDCMRCFP